MRFQKDWWKKFLRLINHIFLPGIKIKCSFFTLKYIDGQMFRTEKTIYLLQIQCLCPVFRRRRLIEDCIRDLRLNNDHIHIIEQEMRKAVKVKKKSVEKWQIVYLLFLSFRKGFLRRNIKLPVLSASPPMYEVYPMDKSRYKERHP